MSDITYPYSESEIDIATDQAMETLIWQAGDIADEDGNAIGVTWDGRYDAGDFPEHQRANMRKRIAAFMERNLADLVATGHVADAWGNVGRIEQIGHDYVLTTGHHGAGFWDRGYGPAGDRLTEACHAESAEWYLSEADDWIGGEPGMVYCQELED